MEFSTCVVLELARAFFTHRRCEASVVYSRDVPNARHYHTLIYVGKVTGGAMMVPQQFLLVTALFLAAFIFFLVVAL